MEDINTSSNNMTGTAEEDPPPLGSGEDDEQDEDAKMSTPAAANEENDDDDDKKGFFASNPRLVWLGAIVFVLIVVGIVVGALAASGTFDDDDKEKSSPSPSAPPSFSIYWRALGDGIPGEDTGDLWGRSVALSADGTLLAVGAPRNDNENGNLAGHARVYAWQPPSWIQVGQDLDGTAAGDNAGSSVALSSSSSSGTIVAVGVRWNDVNGENAGLVRPWQLATAAEEEIWAPLGTEILGNQPNAWLGSSVSLSADGSHLAVGAPVQGGQGYAQVYEFRAETDWNQIGPDLEGDGAVSLSADGTLVAVGAPTADNGKGRVSISQLEASTADETSWTLLGTAIPGPAFGARWGDAVSLLSGSIQNNDNATDIFVAIGAPRYSGQTGFVQVYRYDASSTVWSQVGQDLEGDEREDYFGTSLSMILTEDKHLHLAIGASQFGKSGDPSGYVRVLFLDATTAASATWQPLGQDLMGQGEGGDDGFGESVSLSSNGRTLAVGAPYHFNVNTGGRAGQVQVFELIE